MCVPSQACANAGIIINNCIPCDQMHCGTYSDGCTGAVDCGTCPGSSNYCSTEHVCKAADAGCSATKGLYGNVCVQFPITSITQTVYCPAAPSSDNCAWDAGSSCWKCNGVP